MMEDDPRFDPVIRRHASVRGVWGWVAAVSSLLLIGFIVLASWNNNIASSDSRQTTTASRTATPPSIEGSGSSSPKPITPAPSKSGTQ
jgi:ABC-type phosphate transport system substrate-binding protein